MLGWLLSFSQFIFSLGPPSSARFLYSKVRREFTDFSAQGPHLIGSLLDPDTQLSDVL